MAKFTVEVDLDWLDEETTIDEEIKERVIRGAEDYLMDKTTDEIQKKLENSIGKKLIEAEEKVQEVIDGYIEAITTEKISKLMIAEKTSTWSDEVKMTPISEYIGKRFEAFCNEKIYNKKFERTNYNSEKVYSITEASINKYLKENLTKQVEQVVKNAQMKAEQEIVQNLEQSLKNNLAEETVKKMNIPKVLERLQESYMLESEE